jgi:hypothetical protein
MIQIRRSGLVLAAVLLIPCLARGENAAAPVADPVLDPPTLHSLGAYWMIKGDDNKNAVIQMAYRKAGTSAWTKSLPMLRVEKGAHNGIRMKDKHQSKLVVPDDGWLFAGSVVLLTPNTDYELQLSLTDPDGGNTERVLKCRTTSEPVAPATMHTLHVIPGSGGGTGSESDPFKGLGAAQDAAKPGDLFLLHAGVYSGPWEITKSGEPGKPIIWRGVGDGEAAIEGNGKGNVITANDAHDVWFEKLSVRNSEWGIAAKDAQNIVIRRCHIYKVNEGITAAGNRKEHCSGFFISDNLLEGQFYPWIDCGPVGAHNKEWEKLWETEWRGIEIAGCGHEICFNRVHNFKDALDVSPSRITCAIDFHNNDCSESNDDGIEMDYSERNTRCFFNRFTNVFQGVSVQPIFGGPVYIFRNVIYNCAEEPFKFHNSPSGAIFFHNTVVKKDNAWAVWTPEAVRNSMQRNNLFIGTASTYAFECDPKMIDCDFDYDGFGGGPWQKFLKWNGVKFDSLDQLKAAANAPYKHAVVVDAANVFASGLHAPEDRAVQFPNTKVDARLKAGCAAIDAGEILPGFNDGFKGKAPDLGAYELGDELPQYGPRPEK